MKPRIDPPPLWRFLRVLEHRRGCAPSAITLPQRRYRATDTAQIMDSKLPSRPRRTRPRRVAPLRAFAHPRGAAARAPSFAETDAMRAFVMLPTSASSSSSTTPPRAQPLSSVVRVAARLRRGGAADACALLYAVEMSSSVSALSAMAAASPADSHAYATAVLHELHSAAPAGMEASSLWGGYLAPTAPQLQHRCATWSDDALLQCLCQLVRLPDAAAADTVKHLMSELVRRWAKQRTTASGATVASQPPQSNMESAMRRVVEAASAALLPAVVAACQIVAPRTGLVEGERADEGSTTTTTTLPSSPAATAASEDVSQAEADLHGDRCWHPGLSGRAVRVCMQQMVDVLTALPPDRRRGKPEEDATTAVPLAVRQQLQQCCLCVVPRSMDDRTRHDCAMLAMTALKHAPFPSLLAAYAYFRAEGLVSSVVAQRFLAHCGVCVKHVAQRGLSLAVALSPATAPAAAAQAVLHASETALRSGRESRHAETSLRCAAAALNALGYPRLVRAVLVAPVSEATLAEGALQESAYSVVSQVLLGDVAAAVASLGAVGASRAEGWVVVPPVVMECMTVVSRFVGREGRAEDVDALYAALVGFHNAGLFISYYVECVLAGLCDRMQAIRRQLQEQQVRQQYASRWLRAGDGGGGLVTSAPPHEVLEQVIPVLRATLRYVGDELNADMILDLVETSLHLGEYAVPLTAAVVWAIRAWLDLSLCLQDLLCRVDASTHNVPFLHYYALCNARDFGTADVFDHLAALWHVDGTAIWNRAPHLAPSCQLWKCADCGRLNSDRYNYCLCSALRYSHVVCGACGYAQDERLRQCRSCGTTLLTAASLAGAVARKAWHCRDCRARNPAKQTLRCFRCGRPNGPAVQQTAAKGLAGCDSCRGDGTDAVYAAAVGVCHTCGRFKMDHAAQRSLVWVCVGCQQRRSTLERVCPSCPQVECLPHAVCRDSLSTPRVCRHCDHAEPNPFVMACSGCASESNPFSDASGTASTTSAESRSPGTGGAASSPSTAHVCHWCFHCQSTQPWDATLPALSQRCHGCGAVCEEKGLCALPQRRCVTCRAVVPPRYAATAVCPYCASVMELPPQPPQQPQTRSGDAATRRWTAVTMLHTCEVLDGCCGRDAMMNGTAAPTTTAVVPAEPITSSNDTAGGLSALLRRRPVLEQTVALLRREWVSTDDAVVWLSMRMDLVTLLGRALNRLRARLPTSLTARRVSALFKCTLAHVDTVCGAAATGDRSTVGGRAEAHFTKLEVCHECLGTHPAELCPFVDKEGSAVWTCEECGAANDNADVCRYVCGSCLSLRPVVQDMLVSTCWQCRRCDRASPQLERYCTHCGLERAGWTPALLPYSEAAASRTEEEGEGEVEGVGHDTGVPLSDSPGQRETPPPRDDEIPFAPAKCALCGLVYIEARCPLCLNHIPDVADAKGTVCQVQPRCAFIQPSGTTRPQDRIYVGEALLQTNPLREGLLVHYTAELGSCGRMQATLVRC